MNDGHLLLIMAGVLSAIVQFVGTPLLLWLRPAAPRPDPLMTIFIYFPIGGFIIWGVLYIAYRLFFNSYP
ncbi:hypothetical protein D3C87_1116670 [compost metagenome]